MSIRCIAIATLLLAPLAARAEAQQEPREAHSQVGQVSPVDPSKEAADTRTIEKRNLDLQVEIMLTLQQIYVALRQPVPAGAPAASFALSGTR